jgi:hypothetical protein
MANPNVPFGLRPARGVSSEYVTGGGRHYVHDSGDGTALYVGDPVKLAGANTTVNGVSYPQVVRAATTDVIVGVVVSALPDTRDSLPYVAASTTRIVFVDDDPNSLFEIQDVNSGTALVASDVGNNVSFVGTGGDTTTGLSSVTLDNTTENTTNTLALKIVNVINRADVDLGSTGPLRFHVRINRHQFSNQVAGV